MSQKNDLVIKLNSMAMDETIAEENLKKIKESLEDKNRECRDLVNRKNTANDKLNDVEKKLRDLGEEMIKCELEINNKYREAEEICPERVDTDKSPVEIQKQLESKKNLNQLKFYLNDRFIKFLFNITQNAGGI